MIKLLEGFQRSDNSDLFNKQRDSHCPWVIHKCWKGKSGDGCAAS
jgi:hypothetical protein